MITLDVKGVLKGGEIPPQNKKYKRIDDVIKRARQ